MDLLQGQGIQEWLHAVNSEHNHTLPQEGCNLHDYGDYATTTRIDDTVMARPRCQSKLDPLQEQAQNEIAIVASTHGVHHIPAINSEVLSTIPIPNTELQNQYERKPRRKTRQDRYEPQSGTVRQNADSAMKNAKKRKVVARRSNRSSRIIDAFQAANVRQGRLTIHRNDKLGIFKKGKTSSPVHPHAIPCLNFSETSFLSKNSKYFPTAKQSVHQSTSQRATSKVVLKEDVANRFESPTIRPRDRYHTLPCLDHRHHTVPSATGILPTDPSLNNPSRQERAPPSFDAAIEQYIEGILRDCHQLEHSQLGSPEFVPTQAFCTLDDLKGLIHSRQLEAHSPTVILQAGQVEHNTCHHDSDNLDTSLVDKPKDSLESNYHALDYHMENSHAVTTPTEALTDVLMQPDSFRELMELEEADDAVDLRAYSPADVRNYLDLNSGDMAQPTERFQHLLPLDRDVGDPRVSSFELTPESRISLSSPHVQPTGFRKSRNEWWPLQMKRLSGETLTLLPHKQSGPNNQHSVTMDSNRVLSCGILANPKTVPSGWSLPRHTIGYPIQGHVQSELAATSSQSRGFWRQNKLY